MLISVHIKICFHIAKPWIKHCFPKHFFLFSYCRAFSIFPVCPTLLATSFLWKSFLFTEGLLHWPWREKADLCNSRRCPSRPRRQTESEMTSLTPMSAFSLRNRYLSRLGAQVRSAPTPVVTGVVGTGFAAVKLDLFFTWGCCLLLTPSLPPTAARPLLHPPVITCLQERSEMMPSSQSALRSLMTHSVLTWI